MAASIHRPDTSGNAVHEGYLLRQGRVFDPLSRDALRAGKFDEVWISFSN